MRHSAQPLAETNVDHHFSSSSIRILAGITASTETDVSYANLKCSCGDDAQTPVHQNASARSKQCVQAKNSRTVIRFAELESTAAPFTTSGIPVRALQSAEGIRKGTTVRSCIVLKSHGAQSKMSNF